jgi:gluconate:H+ symporter, GntP family
MLILLIHILLSIIWIIISTSKLNVHPLVALITASIWIGMVSGMDFLMALEEFSKGFGGLIGQIGLIIILGSVFGVLLERSSAAVSLAQALWNGIGKRLPSLSTSIMGSIVGIPVFCDSGFILLHPIGKNLAVASGISPLTFSLSLAGGLYVSHILIPPTPGPLAVTGIFQMENQLGLVLLIGLIITIPVLLVTAWWANKFQRIFPEKSINQVSSPIFETPGVKWSAVVLILPLLMIGLGNLSVFFELPQIVNMFKIIGNPLVAISTGLTVGFIQLREPETKKNLFSESFTKGITIAGPILVLTGAGAGFGAILKQLGLEGAFQEMDFAEGSKWIWILVSFGLAAFLKTAQGSSTSAMIIAASIALSIIPQELLSSPYYSALCISAIGAGAMTVSHANDSYFWIVKEFTGLSVKEALQSYTILTALMGITALAMVMLLVILA